MVQDKFLSSLLDTLQGSLAVYEVHDGHMQCVAANRLFARHYGKTPPVDLLDAVMAASLSRDGLRVELADQRFEMHPLATARRASTTRILVIGKTVDPRSAADPLQRAFDATAEELSQTQAQLEGLCDGYPGLVVVLDPDLGVVRLAGSCARDLGLVADHYDGEPLSRLLNAFDTRILTDAVVRLERGGDPAFDWSACGLHFEGHVRALQRPTGRACGTVLLLKDVTDARLAWAALDAIPQSTDAPSAGVPPTRA